MFLETHETDRPYCLLCCILFGPLLSKGPHPNCQNWACVSFFFFSVVCPAGFCVISYPEKHIWVVVLRLREITDLWAPNHGRRPAAPQAIERLQTAGLSSKYIQSAGALPLEGKPAKPVGKTPLSWPTETEQSGSWKKKKKSKKFWVKVWSISWLEFRFQQLLNET